MAEELARCHPFRGNATVSCDSSSGYMLPGPVCGPDSAVKPREIIQTSRSEQQAATQGASARITAQAAPTMNPSLDPGSRLLGVLGSSTPKKHKADFNHFFHLNLSLPQWSQARRMFSHPARQRPLSPPWHCSVPSRGRDPGHLEKSKRNKENKQQRQRQSEKIINHQNCLSVCPCQGWRGHLLQQKALLWSIFVFSLNFFFEGASYWLICYSTSFIINLKKKNQNNTPFSLVNNKEEKQTSEEKCHRKRHEYMPQPVPLAIRKTSGKGANFTAPKKAEKEAWRSTNRNDKEGILLLPSWMEIAHSLCWEKRRKI